MNPIVYAALWRVLVLGEPRAKFWWEATSVGKIVNPGLNRSGLKAGRPFST